jgi:hypothetical protein
MEEIEVECRKCGQKRTTYNDVRKRADAMIECKAKCFETHSQWAFVRSLSAPAKPSALVTAAPVQAANGSPPKQKDDSSSDDDGDNKPKARQAFADSPEKGKRVDTQPAQNQKPKEEEPASSGCCAVM